MSAIFESIRSAGDRTWLEIDLDALKENTAQIRALLPKSHRLIATVKANAYGHGDHRIAAELQKNGIDFFGVSNLEEAIGLRDCGITGEILILGYTAAQNAKLLAKHNIIQTIYSLEGAKQLSDICTEKDLTVRVHFKLDTGMGRIGFVYDDPNLIAELSEAAALPHLQAEGIFTHLSSADMSDPDSAAYTKAQLQRFDEIVKKLRKDGYALPIAHIQNSAGILQQLSSDFEASRAGIILYGMYPSDEITKRIPLKPLMSWKAVISYVKELPAGHSVSYGRRFTSEKPMRVATVPVGYADGYFRSLSSRGYCIVHGVRCPIIGNICMDQMMLDVTDVPQAKMGDIITVMGKEGDVSVTAEDLAALCSTINYEITCNPSRRVPRVYLQNGSIIAIENDARICAEYAAQKSL